MRGFPQVRHLTSNSIIRLPSTPTADEPGLMRAPRRPIRCGAQFMIEATLVPRGSPRRLVPQTRSRSGSCPLPERTGPRGEMLTGPRSCQKIVGTDEICRSHSRAGSDRPGTDQIRGPAPEGVAAGAGPVLTMTGLLARRSDEAAHRPRETNPRIRSRVEREGLPACRQRSLQFW